MEQEQKTLLELLLDPVEATRVKAVQELITQADGYFRVTALSLAGMATQTPSEESARVLELVALHRTAREVSQWLTNLGGMLANYLQQSAPTQDEAEPTIERATLH